LAARQKYAGVILGNTDRRYLILLITINCLSTIENIFSFQTDITLVWCYLGVD